MELETVAPHEVAERADRVAPLLREHLTLTPLLPFAGVAEELGTEALARKHAAEHGLVYVSPYNDVDVIAGQGSIGVEMVEQAGERGLDAVFVAVGGGGLISGIAAVLKRRLPGVRVYGASPSVDAA